MTEWALFVLGAIVGLGIVGVGGLILGRLRGLR